MTLHFRYKVIAVGYPVVPLGGRRERPRPIVGVTLIGPLDARLRDAVVDPAADDTLFPASLAAQVGIDLTNAPRGTGRGVGGATLALHVAGETA